MSPAVIRNGLMLELLYPSRRGAKLELSLMVGAILSVACLVAATSNLVGGAIREAPAWTLSWYERLGIAAARRDGEHYVRIATEGYQYVEGRPCNVAFFPLYPVMIASVHHAFGIDGKLAGVIVSNSLFLLFLFLLFRYSEASTRSTGRSESKASMHLWCVLSAASLPTSFFFRVVYSESLFVALATLLLLFMREGKKPIWPALVCCLLTASRPVGVAFVPSVMLYAWCWRDRSGVGVTCHRQYPLVGTAFCSATACGGIIAYAIYLAIHFGHPFAFAETQEFYTMRPVFGWRDKINSLVTFEPVWGTYVSDSIYFWGTSKGAFGSPWMNLQFANPIFWLGTILLLCLGAWKRILTSAEILASIGLLAIPYVTRAYEMSFNSQARFCLAVIPCYLVMGRFLASIRILWAVLIVGASATVMTVYAACFAGGALFI